MGIFIGREKELKQVTDVFEKGDFETFLVYGRKRIGKTELITRAASISKKPFVYSLCQESSETLNVATLKDALGAIYPEASLLEFSSFYKILKFIFELSTKSEFIFVLDEYPFARDCVKGLDTILMKLIEDYKRTSKMKLVLCGSYIKVMEEIIEENGPLFGRFPNSLKLGAMDYYEASLFCKDYSPDDKLKFYSVFGGVPFYLSLIDTSKSFHENLISLLLRKASFIRNEMEGSLFKELGAASMGGTVFNLIATGTSHFSDINVKSGVSSAVSLSATLKKLIDLETITKVYPINDKANKKKAQYLVYDSLANFYFTYIFPHLSSLEIMSPECFYEHFIKEDFEKRYLPLSFENISRQFLIRENMGGLIKPVFLEIGKYWYDLPKVKKNGEFDLVARNALGYSFFECKYTKAKVTDEVVSKEREQVAATGFPLSGFGFFSKSGFDLKKEKLDYAFTIDDLYK